MKKNVILMLIATVLAIAFGLYESQRAIATEEYGFNYVQHAINVIDASDLSQTKKDSLIQDITDGAPDYQGISLDFSDSSAFETGRGSPLFLKRSFVRVRSTR